MLFKFSKIFHLARIIAAYFNHMSNLEFLIHLISYLPK